MNKKILISLEKKFLNVDEIVGTIIKSICNGDKAIVTFINPHYFWLKNKYAKECGYPLERFDAIGIDGFAMTLFLRVLFSKTLSRASFDSTSVADKLFSNDLFSEKSRIFLLGASENENKRAIEVLKKKFPQLNIVGRSGGYFDDFSEIVALISNTRANFVVVGMGAPLQEAIAVKLKDSIDGITICTCGGYISQLVNGYQYYPRWVNALQLRFVYRLFKDPKRIGRRLFIEYVPFFKEFAKVLLK